MRSTAVPLVYERWWRPTLGWVAKGGHGPTMAEEHDLAVSLLDLRHGQIVLDVACGTGAFTRGFATAVGPDGTAIGLDRSRTMLAQAVRQTSPDQSVVFLRADAERPPLRPGSVDAICCFAALHLFDDAEAALSSFASLLKPGGRVAVLTSARRTWLPLRLFDSGVGSLSGMRMFDRGEVAGLLRDREFTDVTERADGVVQIVGARRR